MSQIIPFNAPNNTLPAHIADMFGEAGNIGNRVSINQLSVKGKVWRRIVDGEETMITRRNPDTGDTEPVSIISVVVLDQNRNRSRAYHPGGYEEGKNAAPACYSADGVTPDSDVKEPCAKTCATCPNSVKGSKITESGKQTTACSPLKRIAVVPSGGVSNIATHPPLLLKVAQTSIWDKDNPEESQGWYAWDQYCDMLRARGAKHTAAVETKVKFDMKVAYPKLLFSAARWLSPEEAVAAKSRLDGDADTIATIISGSAANDGLTGKPSPEHQASASNASHAQQAQQAADVAAAQHALNAEAATAAKAQADAQAKASADAAAAKARAEAATKAAQAKAAAAKAAAEAAAAEAAAAEAAVMASSDAGGFGGDGGFGGEVVDARIVSETPAKAAASAASTPVQAASVVEGTPAGLADLLEGWDS